MSDTVFILGAGASAGGPGSPGCPVMSDFLARAQFLLATGAVEDVRTEFETVVQAIGDLQPVHSKSQLDLTNIESVFTCFELAATLDKFPGEKKRDMPELIRSLKVLIARTIESTLRFREGHAIGQKSAHLKLPPHPYLGFAKLVSDLTAASDPGHSVSIITFNYDIGCDYALHFLGIPFHYALQSDMGSGKEDAIPLLKLHGSLNWRKHAPDAAVKPYYLRDVPDDHYDFVFTNTAVRGEWLLKIDALLKYADHGEVPPPEPFIVPPTWNKGQYHGDVASVWATAARELTDAKNIIVIGYSLPETDVFFRYLYSLGTVGADLLQRFWVFDPDPTGVVKQRFQALLGPGALNTFKSPIDVETGKQLGFENAIFHVREAMINKF